MLDPIVTVETQKECCVIYNVLDNTTLIIIPRLASSTWKYCVCFLLLIIIMRESNMEIVAVISSASIFLATIYRFLGVCLDNYFDSTFPLQDMCYKFQLDENFYTFLHIYSGPC